METKNQKFQRLAEKRVNRILDELRLIGNLSNSSNYSYELKQVNKIFKAIQTEIKFVELRFRKISPCSTFSLVDPKKEKIKTPVKVKKIKKITDMPKIKEVKLDRCSNCFEFRPLQKYLNLFLCKRCYHKRKTIRKIKKINGFKGGVNSLVN